MTKHSAHPKFNAENLEITLYKVADKLRVGTDTSLKTNDQLKTNTALQMESAKIEFKVI